MENVLNLAALCGARRGADRRSGIMKTFFVPIGTDNVDITIQYLIFYLLQIIRGRLYLVKPVDAR